MALFKINGSKVKKMTTVNLLKEKYLQKLFEDNLEEVLNITFLAHEYSTSFGGRIDSLGIDKNGAPCIIEYKLNQNENVINQGLSYLRWMLDHKSDFKILCQNNKINIEIDWNSPRVICIAENYNKFDIDTADLLPINIELLRYRIYDNEILYLEPENYQKVKISTSGIIKKANNEKFKKEILPKDYTLEDHLEKNSSNEIKQLFHQLREKILSIDENIKEEPKAKYIAYKLTTNFVDITLQTKSIVIFLNINSGKLKDPKNLARDLTKPKPVGHWGNGDYEIIISNDKDIDYIFSLIKQSYEINK